MAQKYKGYSFDMLVKPVADSKRRTFTAVVHHPPRSRDRVTELNCTQDFTGGSGSRNGSSRICKKMIDEGKAAL
jgi:hypothetical protein